MPRSLIVFPCSQLSNIRVWESEHELRTRTETTTSWWWLMMVFVDQHWEQWWLVLGDDQHQQWPTTVQQSDHYAMVTSVHFDFPPHIISLPHWRQRRWKAHGQPVPLTAEWAKGRGDGQLSWVDHRTASCLLVDAHMPLGSWVVSGADYCNATKSSWQNALFYSVLLLLLVGFDQQKAYSFFVCVFRFDCYFDLGNSQRLPKPLSQDT